MSELRSDRRRDRLAGQSIMIHTFLGITRLRHSKSLHLYNIYTVPSPRATYPNIYNVEMSYSLNEFIRRSNCKLLACVCNVSRLALY